MITQLNSCSYRGSILQGQIEKMRKIVLKKLKQVRRVLHQNLKYSLPPELDD